MKRYAAGFQAHGVKPGDRICVMLENSVEAFLAAYGLVFAGATLILCCPAHSECKDSADMGFAFYAREIGRGEGSSSFNQVFCFNLMRKCLFVLVQICL